MAEQSGFFDSIDNDRVYASNWLAGYIAAIISNGVYNLELAVIANDNMSVKVEPGRAWINGYFYKNIGDFNLSIDIADGVTHRKDIVVLRFDINKRAINLQVVKGEFSGTPVAPEVTRNAEVYDLELCEISIPAGTTKITQSMITDKRLDKNLCGIVHGVVEQIDTTTLLKQMEDWFERFKQSAQGDLDNLEAEFDQWFETIKGKLSEDIAGSLQTQIDTKVSKSGDTMTGDLILPNTTPTKTYQAVHKKYVDDNAGGKRTCRFVVGTSTAGWTSKDCDYLCDGTDDQVEIQAAINALPSTGGEVVVLDGTYNITASISVNKNNVTLRGCGVSTVLKRMWNSSGEQGVVTISSSYYSCIKDFRIDGNKANYTDEHYNLGGYVANSSYIKVVNIISENNSKYGFELYNCNNNTITGNTCNNNNSYGIYLANIINNNTITGNTCNNNNSYGIYLANIINNNTITGNTCNNNNSYGIYLSGNNNNNTITGNTCNNNSYGIYLGGSSNNNSSSNNTVTGNTCNNNNSYGIYLSSSSNNTVTGNTCNNNNYGIYLYSSNNTVTGNTCNNNNNYGIYISDSNNTITGNTCNNNNYGIYLYSINNNTITGNTYNNNNYGIYLYNNNNNNTITGNTCNNNNNYGIYLSSGNNNTITGNTCIRGTGLASDYTSTQYTIRLASSNNNYNLIACNNIMGKNYVSGGGTGNTFVNNKYN